MEHCSLIAATAVHVYMLYTHRQALKLVFNKHMNYVLEQYGSLIRMMSELIRQALYATEKVMPCNSRSCTHNHTMSASSLFESSVRWTPFLVSSKRIINANSLKCNACLCNTTVKCRSDIARKHVVCNSQISLKQIMTSFNICIITAAECLHK